MNKVDIIIPIYNAYDFTKKCIETVIENTDLNKHYLILINDKSPDERIEPLLKEVKEKNDKLNIVVLENEANLGFVKTVNKGMSYSKNDVVLLNSDTEVTKNWLNKMIDAAYSKENIASVTPLSNNATIASIPNFLEENDLPSFIGLDEYSKAIEECSFNDFPQMSTGHGFCMYIRREAIDEVGLFDDITFEKGYGEENDFSYRCVNKGFVHLLCDNTFIYHKGTQSFTEKKLELINSHLKILQEKYPANFDQTNSIVNSNPYSYIQDNIKYHINNKYRKNILFVTHDFPKKSDKLVGGTTLHIYDLIENLKNEFNIHVFYLARNNEYKVTSFFEDSTSEINFGKINSFGNVNLFNNEYKKIVNNVFSLINIDLVHIHHMKNHYFDLIDVIKENNKEYVFTLHDFYMVCPTIVLLEKMEKYCADIECPDCNGCLKKVLNVDRNIIDEWRKNAYKTLKSANLVFAPSNSTKEIFNKYYNDISITVIEHGEDYKKIIRTNKSNKKKNIAFIGGINKNKGVDFLRELINKAGNDELNYNIHMFGGTSDVTLNKSSKNYIYHGLYNREDITKLLGDNEIDLICLFSIWPETYSYTLTEALTAQVPVIALDYGAVSERIKNDNLGWVIEKDSDINDIIEKIKNIFGDENEYNRVLSSINKYLETLKSVLQNAEEYKKIYNKLIVGRKNEFKELDKELLKVIYKNTKVNNNEIERTMFEQNLIDQQNIERAEHNNRIVEYDTTVRLLREEIDRLNEKLEDVRIDKEKYNKLLNSRRIKLLKKIKFIKY